MRLAAITVIAIAAWGMMGMAIGLDGELYTVYAPLDNVNGLIEQHENATAQQLPELHIGTGGSVRLALLPVFDAGSIYVGGRGAFYAITQRDTEVRASHVGVSVGTLYRLRGWVGAADVGVYRGSFAFPSARYPASSACR